MVNLARVRRYLRARPAMPQSRSVAADPSLRQCAGGGWRVLAAKGDVGGAMPEDTHARLSRLETDVATLRGEVRNYGDAASQLGNEVRGMREEMRGVREEVRTIVHQVEPILGVVKQARLMLPLLAFLIVGAQMFLQRPSGGLQDAATRDAERAVLIREVMNVLKETSK